MSYQGQHYQLSPMQFLPTSVQQPRIPIWVAGIAIYVALEKMLPVGPWLSRAAGATLAALGTFVLIRAI